MASRVNFLEHKCGQTPLVMWFIYNKKYIYLVFVIYVLSLRPCFWCRAPKTLNFLSYQKSKGIFCYANEVVFRRTLRIGAVAGGNNLGIRRVEGWNFQSLPLQPAGKGEGCRTSAAADGQWSNQPFHETCGVLRASTWVNTGGFWERNVLEGAGKLPAPPLPFQRVSFIWPF